MWEALWEDQFIVDAVIPYTVRSTLQCVDKDAFPNVFTILQILATIPISSASCERSISTLRNLKNYLRNTMSEDRLNGLAMMYAHRDMSLEQDQIIDLIEMKIYSLEKFKMKI